MAYVCYVVLWPISVFSTFLSRILLRLVGVKMDKEAEDEGFSKVDLDYLVQSSIDNAEKDSDIDDEVKIFQNALDFSDTKVRDCMVPRTEIQAVETDASLDELRQKFIESGNSKSLSTKRISTTSSAISTALNSSAILPDGKTMCAKCLLCPKPCRHRS